MKIITTSDTPIFMQIAEGIEDAILLEIFPEKSQVPSTTEFSIKYKINPGTALKGISILVDEGTLYKKRGVGMFVAEGAILRLLTKRKEAFYTNYISDLITEAKRLHITEIEIQKMIESGFQNGQ